MSGVISKKLKFKGDKPKKKKRSHRDTEDGTEELAALAAADPRGESGFVSRT
jgi:protein FRG1